MEVENLASISLSQFKKLSPELKDEVLLKRSRHVVSEHNRVLEAVKVLKEGQLDRFGQLMTESHVSLRDDYEVSTAALDFLVEESLQWEGTLGSRLTGAGFGGCTVNLVKKESVPKFCQQISARYKAKFGIEADTYPISVEDGVRKII